MGGYGSTRWGRHPTKVDTDGLPKLDVRWLARQGYLDPNTAGVYAVAWTRGDASAGDILVCFDADRPDELDLDYRVRWSEGDPWQTVRERVPLDASHCP